MLTVSELQSVLKIHGLRLTKRLGQNHLIDYGVVTRFIDRCRFLPEEIVVEIGAGLGALTEPLADRVSRVWAVEVEQSFAALLTARLAHRPNVTVVCQDILELSWDRFRDITVVGAIPYHITSPILVALNDARHTIRRAILIMQHEVAQRLLAAPGTKAYGRLSLLAQYGWDLVALMELPRHAFFPQPAVDSCALHMTPRAQPLVAVEDEQVLFDVVKAAFAHRRKTLVNCLVHEGIAGLSRVPAEAMLQRLGLATTIRGEQLTLDQFAALANALRHPS